MSTKKLGVVIVILLLLFIGLAVVVVGGESNIIDEHIDRLVINLRSDALTPLVIGLSWLGSVKGEITVLILCSLWLFIRYRDWRKMLLITTALAGAVVWNTILKHLFERPRPELEHLMEASGYSFPSGHATMTSAFYGMITYFIWQYYRKKGMHTSAKWIPLIGAVFVLMMGLGRVYLGVHYTTDILAGFAAGGLWLCLLIGWLQRKRRADRIRVLEQMPR